MTKLEYDEKYKLIKALRASSTDLRNELAQKIKTIPLSCGQFLDSIKSREQAFDAYTTLLSEFQFNEDELAPLNQFPGITVSKSIQNPEELQAKGEKMKKAAFEVKNEAKKTEAFKQHGIQDLKRTLNALVELAIQVDQIYELELELLQDLDSVYDIGDLKSATVNG